MESFEPLLTTRDWNEEWKALQRQRHHADNSEYWDDRAKSFGDKDVPSPYVRRFLELSDIRPGEAVFDMGCGTGALAVPLGQAGHKVLAADFSSGMLDCLRADLAAHKVEGVETRLLSWDDEPAAWEAAGAGPDSADVALASRSIATYDLRESLLRLTEVARRRCCITLAAGASPRIDERVLAGIGVEPQNSHDYLYAFNILANEGLKPQVSYIDSTRPQSFDSPDAAFEALSEMVDAASGGRLSASERAATLDRLREWLEGDLVENEHAGEPDRKGVPQGRLRLSEPRKFAWAFISWDK